MATGILIVGSSGAGKTTLGKIIAEKLRFTFVDIDDYIWRKDTEIPFTEMYPKAEKIHRLMEAIKGSEHFVMAGSMTSFHEFFDPFFEMVVYLHTDVQIRVKRVHEREFSIFGNRILQDGDMFEQHQKYLTDIAGYDYGKGSCTLQEHEVWLKLLKCKVISLDGEYSLENNANIIINEYKKVQNHADWQDK